MIILIRGGSIAAGFGVEKSYVDLLKEYYAPHGIEIINRSHAKETSFDGAENLGKDLDQFQPNILIIHYAVDDAFHPVMGFDFKENLVQMVRLGKKRLETQVLLATSQTFADPNDMNSMNLYYRFIREVAFSLDCDLIPVHSYWAAYILHRGLSNSDLTQSDERYPNMQGHKIFAEAFRWKLNRILNGLGYQFDKIEDVPE